MLSTCAPRLPTCATLLAYLTLLRNLPNTRVQITGNHRTTTELLGKRAVVIGYLANGWHRVRLEREGRIGKSGRLYLPTSLSSAHEFDCDIKNHSQTIRVHVTTYTAHCVHPIYVERAATPACYYLSTDRF
eukprot:1178480-Prorocentrum_minimum.AAC.2